MAFQLVIQAFSITENDLICVWIDQKDVLLPHWDERDIQNGTGRGHMLLMLKIFLFLKPIYRNFNVYNLEISAIYWFSVYLSNINKNSLLVCFGNKPGPYLQCIICITFKAKMAPMQTEHFAYSLFLCCLFQRIHHIGNILWFKEQYKYGQCWICKVNIPEVYNYPAR